MLFEHSPTPYTCHSEHLSGSQTMYTKLSHLYDRAGRPLEMRTIEIHVCLRKKGGKRRRPSNIGGAWVVTKLTRLNLILRKAVNGSSLAHTSPRFYTFLACKKTRPLHIRGMLFSDHGAKVNTTSLQVKQIQRHDKREWLTKQILYHTACSFFTQYM